MVEALSSDRAEAGLPSSVESRAELNLGSLAGAEVNASSRGCGNWWCGWSRVTCGNRDRVSVRCSGVGRSDGDSHNGVCGAFCLTLSGLLVTTVVVIATIVAGFRGRSRAEELSQIV